MPSKKSINEKLKESVKKSLARASQPTLLEDVVAPVQNKKPTPKSDYDDTLTELGIPKYNRREPEVTIYKLKRCLYAHLDRSKYPMERDVWVKDSPIFATWDEASKYADRLDKTQGKVRTWYYSVHSTSCKQSELDKKTLAKCKERGWGFH